MLCCPQGKATLNKVVFKIPGREANVVQAQIHICISRGEPSDNTKFLQRRRSRHRNKVVSQRLGVGTKFSSGANGREQICAQTQAHIFISRGNLSENIEFLKTGNDPRQRNKMLFWCWCEGTRLDSVALGVNSFVFKPKFTFPPPY